MRSGASCKCCSQVQSRTVEVPRYLVRGLPSAEQTHCNKPHALQPETLATVHVLAQGLKAAGWHTQQPLPASP